MVLSAYFSHPIRGAAGESATPEQIHRACRDCSWMARRIQTEMAIDLYVPADHDEFVQIAYKGGLLTERAILLTDCEILAKRDFVLAYDPSGQMVSRGMRVEIEHALAIGKPVFLFKNWNEWNSRRLHTFLGWIRLELPIAGVCRDLDHECLFTACDYRTKE